MLNRLILFWFLDSLLLAVGACQPVAPAQLTPLEAATAVLQPTGTLPPTLTPQPSTSPSQTALPTSSPGPTPSPTPLFVFDLTRYDPDLFQPIVVEHNIPIIASADEKVLLEFGVINTIYCGELQRNCQLNPVLYYSYGEAETFQSIPLRYEVVHEMEPLVARLPAADYEGRPLHYYAEFAVPEAGYTLRYPGAGVIDPVVTPNIIPVELPAAGAVEPGDQVYEFLWGYGPDQVRFTYYSPDDIRAGPPALDVGSDGKIALMDPVNERILVFNPIEDSFAAIQLPFAYKFNGDLAYDQADRLMVCDFVGEEDEHSSVNIPTCYRLLPDGRLENAAPVYAKFPEKITDDHQVLDGYDGRLVTSINSYGEASSREAQRQKQPWDLPYRFVETEQGLSPFTARFADANLDVLFEVHANVGLGMISGFEKTPRGYLLVFNSRYEQIRAVWITHDGQVLKDITLPNGQFSEMSFGGQTAIAPDGSLYVMSSTERGIEIHYIAAP